MDIDFVFLIMLFVFYVLSRLGGKKKPQQERPPESGTRPSRNTNPELDELDEIAFPRANRRIIEKLQLSHTDITSQSR